MGQYLRVWSMDFPPGIAVLANTARSLFGDTLSAIRFFPALGGMVVLVLAGLIARELGGGRSAQAVAALAVLLSPLFLRTAALFQPVVFDQLWWTLGFFALLKVAQSSERRWWLLLGIAGGLGLLTKFSILFFGFGVLAGLVLSAQRRALGTPWPYVAVLIALIVGSPTLVGQIQRDFPVVDHMHDLQSAQLERLSAIDFLTGQVLMLGPAVLLAAAGLCYLLRAEAMRAYRVLGWGCVAAFLILLALHGKPYYIGPIYPMLFAAGAVALTAAPTRLERLFHFGVVALIVAFGVLTLPFGLPILPPAPMARFSAAIGVRSAVTTNRGEELALPQDYADMLGWEEQVAAVARVYDGLPAEKRAQAIVLAGNYGEAGALNFFGPRYRLPRAATLSENHWFFAPSDPPGEVAVALGLSPESLARFFKSVNVVTRFDHPWVVPEQRNNPIVVAESPYRSLIDLWPSLTERKTRTPRGSSSPK